VIDKDNSVAAQDHMLTCRGWGSCEVCVVQIGAMCPERRRFTHSGENVSGLAGEAIMMCMEPLCDGILLLASFTFADADR
jgi:ferredoxin